jgi:ubiquinone/menaquinone biosynthesis C-methylase UbiE
MIEQAKAACEGLTNCTWRAGDAMDLSRLVDAPVDCVVIANTFHGVPDKPGLAREVAATLSPGSRFAIVNWHSLARERTTVLGKPRGPRTTFVCHPIKRVRQLNQSASHWRRSSNCLRTTTRQSFAQRGSIRRRLLGARADPKRKICVPAAVPQVLRAARADLPA